jgi:hypothetical protein
VALFDGNAELNALYQAFEALGVVALVSTDHAFGHYMAAIGQGQHDAAIETLNAQVDLIIRCKASVMSWKGLSMMRHRLFERAVVDRSISGLVRNTGPSAFMAKSPSMLATGM